MEDLLQVGIITSTHGVRGEVKVYPTTDDPRRFRRLKEVVLDTGKEKMNLEIEGVKFFKQFVILKFKGLDNINDRKISSEEPVRDPQKCSASAKGRVFHRRSDRTESAG